MRTCTRIGRVRSRRLRPNPRTLISGLVLLTLGCNRGREDNASPERLLQSTDATAIYDAGVEHYQAEDYAAARRLWRRAADLGTREAASNLGYLLYYGFGGAPDSAEGGRFWQAAAAQGDAEAHRHLAQAIWNGDHRLGSEVNGYAHALAAHHLGRHTSQLDGNAVADDAEPLLQRYRQRLSSDERVAAERHAAAAGARRRPSEG